MSFHCKHRALRLWVLASFVLALLVAGASPSIRHHAMELVCSGNGGPAKWVAAEVTKDISTAEAMGMDCPLCLPSNVPPPHFTPLFLPCQRPCIWRSGAQSRCIHCFSGTAHPRVLPLFSLSQPNVVSQK